MLNKFLKLVEIRTKVASIIPLLIGTVYVIYKYGVFNVYNFILMFIALISIDMLTTAINNYVDYRSAIKKSGYNYLEHNAIKKYNMTETSVLIIIFFLLLIAGISGLTLFLNTNELVLILGLISTFIGITYSFGPIPISRTPFGEFMSAFFMGILIPFISVYIHVYHLDIVGIYYNSETLIIRFGLIDIANIVLISLPLFFLIGNIMLANNISDMDDDIINRRYTLPIYIGLDNAKTLYKIMFYMSYIIIIINIILGILPIIFIVLLISYFPLSKLLKAFLNNPSKKYTFINAVKTFIIFNITYLLIFILLLLR